MAEEKKLDLAEKFPDMTPVKSPPTLHTINGIGASVYGKRDFDAETRTYIKTHCFCVIFITILSLGAYRVADAGNGGWYFIGKVPLSSFAKTWNMIVFGAIIGLIGFIMMMSYFDSPSYKAGKMFSKAEALYESGNTREAATSYLIAAQTSPEYTVRSRDRMEALLETKLDSMNGMDAVGLLRTLEISESLAGTGKSEKPKTLAKAYIDKKKATDPESCLSMLDYLIQADPTSKAAYEKQREELLEAAAKANPQNADIVSRWAELLEKRGEKEKLEALLKPCEKGLKTQEGARILGQIYLDQEKIEEAYTLLSPYVEGRLGKLHQAEQALDNTYERVYKQNLAILNRLPNNDPFIQQYKQAATEDAKNQLVDERIRPMMRSNGEITIAQMALKDASTIVPVALDLGIVRLRRAQNMEKPAERKKELEAAEKLFVAIRGVAGESDSYRLYFGQVNYWLGKQEEGKKLFDELLASQKRSPEMLYRVARILREVGEITEARKMAEEGYNSSKVEKFKHDIANFLSIMAIDSDERVKWLKLGDPNDPETQASICESEGLKLVSEGKREEGMASLRKGIAVYEKLPREAATINNMGVLYGYLYQSSYAPADFQKALQLQEEALNLSPSNSIYMHNYCDNLINHMAMDVLADVTDVPALELRPDISTISCFYNDEAGKEKFREKIRKHPDYPKFVALMSKLLILAPKSSSPYSMLVDVQYFIRDQAGIKDLYERVSKASIDNESSLEYTLEYLSGKKDQELQKNSADGMALRKAKLEAAKAKGNPVQIGVQCAWFAEHMIRGLDWGQAYDPAEIVAMAEQGVKSHPCQVTENALQKALLNSALMRAYKKFPEVGKYHEFAKRFLDQENEVRLVAAKNGDARAFLLADPDFQRFLKLFDEERARFPERCSFEDCALLQAVGRDNSKELKLAQSDQVKAAAEGIYECLYPFSTNVIMGAYWRLFMTGKADEARKVLDALAQKGIKVPMP